MAEIFLDEAQELIESANAMLEKWLAEGDNNQMTGLMRNLHTIKGGARMSEIQPVGDLAHELEYIYEGVLEGRFSNSDGLTNLLHAAHDELTNQIEQLSDRQNIRQPLQLIERLQQFRRDGYVADSAQPTVTDTVEQAPLASEPEPELELEPEPQPQPEPELESDPELEDKTE